MTKRSKRRKKGSGRSRTVGARGVGAKPSSDHGFDFGVLPYAMGVSSWDFPKDLRDAEIVAAAYGEAWSPDLKAPVPTITLVAREAAPLVRAFNLFNQWAAATGPDSVELTIVFRSSGGYILAISPEWKRLEKRALGFDRVHRVLMTKVLWCKPFDTTHPFLTRLRDYARGSLAPFLLGGATLTGLLSNATPGPADITSIPELTPLLKFEVTLVDEQAVEPHSTAWLALSIASPRKKVKAGSPFPKDSPAAIARSRIRAIRTHFPLTLEHIHSSPEILVHLTELKQMGATGWQVEQAICNLALSYSLAKCPHYHGLPPSELEHLVLQKLGERFELPHNIHHVFTLDEIRTQIVADTNHLARQLRLKSVRTLSEARTRLLAAGVFAAPVSYLDASEQWTS